MPPTGCDWIRRSDTRTIPHFSSDPSAARTKKLDGPSRASLDCRRMKVKGTVYLVGAGPGDPGLLTLRAADLLKRADVILHDALVHPQILAQAGPSAEVIYAGKRSRDHGMTQEAINDLLVERARRGQCVVRLKGGDPFVFGRGGEEAEHLAQAGIPFEVVPGVSSFHAVPAYAGIPITHREHSSCFTVITGHGDPEREGSEAYWAQFAGTPGTKIIMMGTDRLALLAPLLVRQGLPSATPVAIISWGTTGQQQSVAGTLADIAERASQARIAPPAVIVVGEVVSLRDSLNWFEKRPLFGQRVVVTRAKAQAAEFTGKLTQLGADVLEIPTIRIGPTPEHRPLAEAMAGLGEYDWLIFTSVNGVTTFFELFHKAFPDLRDLGHMRIAAVGPATAASVQALRLHVDAIPAQHTGAQIAKAISAVESVENLRILLVRAEVANPEIVRALEDLGGIVDDIAVYRTEAELSLGAAEAARLQAEGADWITFTSGSTVQHFHERLPLPDLLRRFPKLRLASIGPETTKVLESLSLKPHVEANPHTTEALLQALLHAPRL